MNAQTTIDPAEVAKFEAMAAEWWDPNGKFKPLHQMNPCRLDYITSQIAAEFDRDLTQNLAVQGAASFGYRLWRRAAVGTDGAAGGRCGGGGCGPAEHSRWRSFMPNNRA